MSDEPSNGAPVFKRPIKSRPTRTRDGSPTSTPTNVASDKSETEGSPMTLAAKLKAKQKSRSKLQSRVSFGGDEEEEDGGEVFKVKKSSLSLKVRHSSSQSGLPPNLDQVSISPRNSGPTYSKAYLSELKASTPSTPPVYRNVDAPSIYDASDADISLMDIDTVESVNAETDKVPLIPTSTSIKSAKERRESLRKSGAGRDDDGFISLSLTARSKDEGPHPESRLVREEDELGEGEDDMAEYTGAQERIALGKKSKKEEEKRRRMGMVEMIEDVEDDDEETVEWEAAQIRRGGQREEAIDQTPVKKVYKPAPIPTATLIPTLPTAISRLSSQLSNLTTSHATNTAALSTLASERLALEEKEVDMRKMVVNAEEKRAWFDGMRERMEGVAGFLDEKVPLLEKLEDEYVSLLTERYDMISRRRQEDDADDLVLFFHVPPTEDPGEPEVDEFGRSVDTNSPHSVVRRARRADRTARLSSRHSSAPSQPQSAPTQTPEDEGYLTDSALSPSNLHDFQLALKTLSDKLSSILSDVQAEEFRNPQVGLAKWFGEWRSKFTETYVGAWGGLGLVGAWEFWSRVEMLGWDPLEDRRGLDSFDFYSALYSYSRPPPSSQSTSMEEDEEPELGPDGDLVSAMISTAVIPRLCKLIEGGGFDPYSAKHVRRMVDLAEQVEASVARDNLKFHTLTKAVVDTFRKAITQTQALLAPSLLPSNLAPRFDPSAIPARRRYLSRRMKLLSNLLTWRKYAGGLFGAGDLGEILVGNIMMPVAESGWDVGGEEIMRKALKLTPKEIVPPRLARRLQ